MEASLYTSHSLKVTLLSWCAKLGTPIKARGILGYHAKVGDKTTLGYSKDILAWPLRHLGEALEIIASGIFDQDTPLDQVDGPQTLRTRPRPKYRPLSCRTFRK